MFEQARSLLDSALGLGLEGKDINVWQMSLRAVVVFTAAIALVRLGNQRFMGKSTALDVMLGIVFGAVVSRAITGNAPFFPTLAAGLVLVILHWMLSAIAFRSHRFGVLVKGKDLLLVREGEILWENMRRAHITRADLEEAMRQHGKTPDLGQIGAAHLERNGEISILPKKEK